MINYMPLVHHSRRIRSLIGNNPFVDARCLSDLLTNLKSAYMACRNEIVSHRLMVEIDLLGDVAI
jgi:hypothetical protein